MAVYKFPYVVFPCVPSPAFPDRTEILRPVVHTILYSGTTFVPILAVLDSGADDCIFPYNVGKRLGLTVEKGRVQTFSGAGSRGNTAYFHSLVLVVEGRIRWRCNVGFTRAMDYAGLGLLGQHGFFDHFRVVFNYQQRLVALSPA